MSFSKGAFLLFTCLSLGGSAWAPAGQAQKQGNPQVIQVQVDMVTLPVVVTNREGRRVTDLKQEDFQVFEDKALQKIAGFAATDEPISVALALDSSGSMEKRLARLQNEAIRFVTLLHPDDSVAIMSFADDVNLLEDFSIDRKRNAYGIKETRANGYTSLYEAVWLALEEVLRPVKERNALVLFTDGVDTASRKASAKDTIQLAKETHATIYSIYYNTERDMLRSQGSARGVGGVGFPVPPIIVGPGASGSGSSASEYMAGRLYLTQLAEYTGGSLFDALDMEDLGPAFEAIARELASQYSIGYYSTNTKRDGKFRNVEVRVNRPGLVVRTRKGYVVPKPPKD